jgi:hypothetical protein
LAIESDMEGPHCSMQALFEGQNTSGISPIVWDVYTVDGPSRVERDCQTQVCWSIAEACCKESGTQMAKEGIFLDERSDKWLFPSGNYVSADECDRSRNSQAVVIQRFVRGMLSRMRVAILKELRSEDIRNITFNLLEEALMSLLRDVHEMERRNQPKTVTDVHLCLEDVNQWSLKESERLNATFKDPGDSTIPIKLFAAKKNVLAETIKMRRGIARPKPRLLKYESKILLIRGELIEVFNEQERELIELVETLREEPPLSARKRLCLVNDSLTLLDTLAENKDLTELLRREQDLLLRNRPLSLMVGLRLRILNSFLRLLKKR